jgi:hypothetical protein
MTGLFNPMTTINKMVKPFRHPYKGIVVQVDQDPEYIGRIKVNIPELYGEYIETADGSTAGILPWIYPRFFGKFAGKFEFSVPEKGEVVEVDFPYENPYLGYYTNKPLAKSIWDTILAIDPEEGQVIVDRFKQHYPDVYGSIDRNLTGWYVDKVTNEIFIVQGGKKANITMNSEGSIIVNSPKDMIFTAGENIIFNAGLNIQSTAGENIESTAGTLIKATTPDEIHELDTSLTINAGSQIDVTTATMNTEATVNHTGTVTSSGEGKFNNVTVSQHTHVYTIPMHAAGNDDTDPPTSGT